MTTDKPTVTREMIDKVLLEAAMGRGPGSSMLMNNAVHSTAIAGLRVPELEAKLAEVKKERDGAIFQMHERENCLAQVDAENAKLEAKLAAAEADAKRRHAEITKFAVDALESVRFELGAPNIDAYRIVSRYIAALTAPANRDAELRAKLAAAEADAKRVAVEALRRVRREVEGNWETVTDRDGTQRILSPRNWILSTVDKEIAALTAPAEPASSNELLTTPTISSSTAEPAKPEPVLAFDGDPKDCAFKRADYRPGILLATDGGKTHFMRLGDTPTVMTHAAFAKRELCQLCVGTGVIEQGPVDGRCAMCAGTGWKPNAEPAKPEPVPAFEGDPKGCAFRRDKHEWRVLCARLFERQGDAYMRANHFREKGNDSAAAMDEGMAMAYGIAWEDARSIGGLLGPKPEPVPPPATADQGSWFEPNHHTMNVCAIRRKSDGYWWECNSEHGAGWSDKRIRQAWTPRGAEREIKQHLADQDVEIVQLMPDPVDTARAEGDRVLRDAMLLPLLDLVALSDHYVWHRTMKLAVTELCRRQLEGK